MKLSEAVVRRCTSKLVFLKISQCLQKAPLSESLFNKAEGLTACIFIKKVFICEYCDIFKNNLLVELFLFIILLCDDKILWTSLGTKLTCFIFLVLLLFSFKTLVLESRLHSYFVLVLYQNMSKCNFRRHYSVDSSTILIESLKTRNNCRTSDFSQ